MSYTFEEIGIKTSTETMCRRLLCREAWLAPGNLQPQNVTEFKEKRRETGPPSGWFSVGQHSEMMGFLDTPTFPLVFTCRL